MDINSAKSAFRNILNSLKYEDRSLFLSWCEDNYVEANFSKSYFELRTIAEDIKTMVPVEAVLPTEMLNHSQLETLATANGGPIMHIDSFLYEDEHVDALEEEGKIKRNYCEKCGSYEVAPITFISHSISIKRVQYIFETVLPDLTGKTLLDVGSRFGPVLYGAYYCSSAPKIIGVEINENLCKLQNHIIEKYGLNDRIQVICSDICNVPIVVQSANVIVFNNVFQCFMSSELQQQIWQWLKNNITSGTVIVTIPSMEETLRKLQAGIDLSSWLQPVKIQSSKGSTMQDLMKGDDPELLADTFCYVVK